MFANGNMSGLAGHAKEETTETRPPAPAGTIIMVNYTRPGGVPDNMNIVAKNLFPQTNAAGFDLSSKKAASSHALCCASSLPWRTVAEGVASGSAMGQPKKVSSDTPLLG